MSQPDRPDIRSTRASLMARLRRGLMAPPGSDAYVDVMRNGLLAHNEADLLVEIGFSASTGSTALGSASRHA